MDDGIKVGQGLKFCTNYFSYNDCLLLKKALNSNFNLKASIQSAGQKDKYTIYILKESMTDLINIISPYIVPEMKYKAIFTKNLYNKLYSDTDENRSKMFV